MDSICLDFLNSDWRDWRGSGRRENRLENREWVQTFLTYWGLPPELAADAATIPQAALLALREELRAIFERVAAGEPLADRDLALLNQTMQPYATYPTLARTEDGLRLEPVATVQGWPLVTARIAADFAQLITGDTRRLKICDNPDCRWVFYDQSRNRAGRWCDDKCCGNLMKVRRFREKNK